MASTLYLRLLADGQAQWRVDDDPEIVGQGEVSDIGAIAAGRRLIVLVPAGDCTLYSVSMPTRNRERILRAIPFALEEQLAEDVDDLHFALGKRDAQGRIAVAVVSHARMEEWLASLARAGLNPQALVPEVLALPIESKEWTLLRQPGPYLLRTGPNAGYALDPENLSVLLPFAVEQAEEDPPARLRVIDCDPRSSFDLPPLALETATQDCDDAFAVLVSAYRPGEAINLLQGTYSRSEQLSKLWRPWRAAAALLACWLALQWSAALVDNRRLAEEELALRQRISQVYLDTFPEARNVVDPKIQMQRRLDALRSGGARGAGGLLGLLDRAGEPLAKAQDTHINNLRYKQGKLDVDLELKNLQTLDSLKQQIEDRGLAVEIRSARSRDDKVEGRLEIKEGRS